MRRFASSHAGAVRSNLLAAIICSMSVGVLILNFQIEPAGAVPHKSAAPLLQIRQAPLAPRTVSQDVRDADEAQVGRSTDTLCTDPGVCIPQGMPSSRFAMLLQLAMLDRGLRRLEKEADYTATFYKQEWLGDDDKIGDVQHIELKLRHKPFSVYMKWTEVDRGQELIYVHGKNNGKMILHFGGWKRMLPPLKLDPNGSLALSKARHPVTELGLSELATIIREYRQRDVEHDSVVCRIEADQVFDERTCHCFVMEYPEDRKVEPLYRKTITLIDRDWSVPVVVKNFAWPDDEATQLTGEALDEATLIEFYAYSGIQFGQKLGDKVFDRKNKEYAFRG